MALRSGMDTLISRVRQLANAGTAEYSINDTTYFSDNDIQDILDRNVTYLIEEPLSWVVTTDTGGTARYLTAQAAYGDLETLDSGTAYFNIQTTAGSLIGTATYTPNYQNGRITFSSDQGGTSYFLTAHSFDVYGAAAEVWRQKIANFVTWYDFNADNQTFNRSQAFQNAQEQLAYCESQRGSNILKYGGDVRTSSFMRIDL